MPPRTSSIMALYLFAIGEAAPRQRDQHGDVLAVAAILVAEQADEVALLELDGDQDVAGGGQREQQMPRRHAGRRPEGQQQAEIDRMTDVAVEQRRVEA